MKLGLAQINTKLGDVDYNYVKIIGSIQALGSKADVIVFPEMTLPGYPLHDKIYDKNMLRKQMGKILEIQNFLKTYKKELTVVVGFVDFDENKIWPDGRRLKWNGAAIITAKSIAKYHKQLLPNYDVFYDKRYYHEGEGPVYFDAGGEKATVTICEDIRDDGYDVKPIANAVKAQKTDLIINISSSPFAYGKLKTRLDLIRNHAVKHKTHFVYVNQVGAQDGNVNDGASMVVDKEGRLVYLAPSFQENLHVVELNDSETHRDITHILLQRNNDIYGQILEAIKLGVKDFMNKTHIDNVTIGVSGGIDSAISLYILSTIMPKERIHAFYLPTKHSKSLDYVKELCGNLWVKFHIHDIGSAVEKAIDEYKKIFWSEMDTITYQNIQARERGQILGMYANKFHGLIVNNSNRTEICQGYATLYGDTIGFLSPLGDLIKTQVYDLAQYINAKHGTDIIPDSIIERKASAELVDDQVDPFDYNRDSQAIEDIFCGEDIDEIQHKYNISYDVLKQYKRNNDINEFKRVQSPRVVKLRSQSAGMGRIYPVVFW